MQKNQQRKRHSLCPHRVPGPAGKTEEKHLQHVPKCSAKGKRGASGPHRERAPTRAFVGGEGWVSQEPHLG